jgi:glycerol transport system ATP-binding protein
VTPQASDRSAPVDGRVLVTELSGSESVIHFELDGRTWVSQSHGIHAFDVGSTARLFVDIDKALYFDANHELVA